LSDTPEVQRPSTSSARVALALGQFLNDTVFVGVGNRVALARFWATGKQDDQMSHGGAEVFTAFLTGRYGWPSTVVAIAIMDPGELGYHRDRQGWFVPGDVMGGDTVHLCSSRRRMSDCIFIGVVHRLAVGPRTTKGARGTQAIMSAIAQM